MPLVSTKGRRRPSVFLLAPVLGMLALVALVVVPNTAHAANETVNIWLTSTNDSTGRNVTRGLQQQAPISFSAGNSSAGHAISVDQNTKYQQFAGAGASMTDTAAYLLGSSNSLTTGERNAVMTKLFDPNSGIGLDFLRNPMGASDLARFNYSYDDMPAGQSDPGLNNFSISHDMTDILPLTKQAEQLNPNLKLMMSPWSAPAWMKSDDNFTSHSFLQSQYYGAYAQYFVKTIQAYQAQGVHVDYVSEQNEPGCCDNDPTPYPMMNWNGNGLDFFGATDLLPALHAAGLSTKVLALDWNWSTYANYAAQELADTAVRNDPLFGGLAWHGYDEGSADEQTTVHDQYPATGTFDTEHSGGQWIGNQQNEDMNNIIDYTRNWGQSVVKWSLAVDQSGGPHNGGCGTCTGLITVHDDGSQRVDYTIEYYDMGQLTKFVKPGAFRVNSTADSTIPNVAWENPDGSKALVAYNGTGSAQQFTVNWGNESFSYSLPAATSATFTWGGTQNGNSYPTGQITGYGGKCVDIAGANDANSTQVQLFTCNGTGAQAWTAEPDGTVQALGKCMDVVAAGTANGTKVDLYQCNGTGAQQWRHTSSNQLVNPGSGRCLDATGPSSADGTPLQLWDCTGGSNQSWNLP